jgi:hypothetical protein
MDNSLFVSVTVVAIFHVENFRTDLGTGFTADAALGVDCGYACHENTPDE